MCQVSLIGVISCSPCVFVGMILHWNWREHCGLCADRLATASLAAALGENLAGRWFDRPIFFLVQTWNTKELESCVTFWWTNIVIENNMVTLAHLMYLWRMVLFFIAMFVYQSVNGTFLSRGDLSNWSRSKMSQMTIILQWTTKLIGDLSFSYNPFVLCVYVWELDMYIVLMHAFTALWFFHWQQRPQDESEIAKNLGPTKWENYRNNLLRSDLLVKM